MSATLQQGLASLLIRKTEEGRAKARHGIETWQKAIEAVRQAERIAEHKINLPNEQVQGVQQAAAQVRTTNYVQAVYLENKATTERNEIITTAIGVLQEEIKRREGEKNVAQRARQTAFSERDIAVAVAENERHAAVQRINAETIGSVKEYDFGFFAYLLLVAIFVAYIVYGDFLVHGFFTRLVSAVVTLIVSQLAIMAVIETIVTWLRRVNARARARSRTAAAESTFSIEVEVAEKRLREVTPDPEKRIRHAEAHRKKAEDALQWLKAHV